MANECIPFKEPGSRVTGQAKNDITGKRFIVIGGDISADGAISVDHSSSGRVIGVSAYDAPQGGKVGVIRGARIVVPVTAAFSGAAGADVASDAQGRAVAVGAGVAAGYLETACTSGQDARVCLY